MVLERELIKKLKSLILQMGFFIKRIIKKCLQKFGIFVRIQRFHTPKQFYESLKNKPVTVKEYELRRMAHIVATATNHDFYESLLKCFVPNWQQITIKKAKFIGEGLGESLNTYRKVEIENKYYFEKVYFNDYSHIQTLKWFQDHIYSIIKDKIKIPRIQKMYAGELLTIVYYDYFELSELEEETREKRLIQFSKDLYSMSCKHESYFMELEQPDSIKDFRNYFLYQKYVHLANSKLMDEGIDIKALKKSIDHSKCVLAHGDLTEGNGFKNGILIDWDDFAIYPIGFDPALIFSNHWLKNNKVNITSWLKEHYSGIISAKDWKDFERNFTYFLLIFCYWKKIITREKGKALEQHLMEALKVYF
jgi:hypothetical protein